jgi:serine phosphatase RsbU (regulator of sigma subunit)
MGQQRHGKRRDLSRHLSSADEPAAHAHRHPRRRGRAAAGAEPPLDARRRGARGRQPLSVLPSYEVGGDWFDYVENRDGAWLAIADGAGRGPRAAGLSSVTLAALRAARRNGATLEEAVRTMDETVEAAGGPEFFVTAIVARWHPVYSLFSWINLGHPPPLLIGPGGDAEELATEPDVPLGLPERARAPRRRQRRLGAGERIVLYTDGISRRRTADGPFDVAGIAAAARSVAGGSATATARAIQEAVVRASEDALPDDAAVVVLSPG